MKVILKYRNREITEEDILFIRKLILDNPKVCRQSLSRKLCRAWDWTQLNGVLKDMVCRGLMLALHRAGYIELPQPRSNKKHSTSKRKKPNVPTDIDKTPLEVSLSELQPLDIRKVRRTTDEPLFNGLIEGFHYLSYTQPVGAHLKYMVFSHDRPIACLAWCSSPRFLNCRDRFIGWSPEYRQKNIHYLAYNTRYLILPCVKVPHLASHILGCMAKRISKDWQELYSHPLYFLETFIDPAKYRGTCYYAANWISMGLTTGRGKNNKTQKQMVPIKEMLGYPLNKRFREKLCGKSD